MNWLWPQARNPETSIQVRMGRVTHWFFLVGAVLIWPMLLTMAWDDPNRGSLMVFLFFSSIFVAMMGRASRYILSDE